MNHLRFGMYETEAAAPNPYIKLDYLLDYLVVSQAIWVPKNAWFVTKNDDLWMIGGFSTLRNTHLQLKQQQKQRERRCNAASKTFTVCGTASAHTATGATSVADLSCRSQGSSRSTMDPT